MTIRDGDYIINQVSYERRDGGIDEVCQIKYCGVEICHCTWHPDGAIHCKDRKNDYYDYEECPYYDTENCLR